jgi:hypothetical protein
MSEMSPVIALRERCELCIPSNLTRSGDAFLREIDTVEKTGSGYTGIWNSETTHDTPFPLNAPNYCLVTRWTIPLQAWTGSRRLRLPGFRESAHGGCKVVSSTHRSPLLLTSAKGWCPQRHSAEWRIKSIKNSSNTIGNRTRVLLADTQRSPVRTSDIKSPHALQRSSYSITNSVFQIYGADAQPRTQPTDIQKCWREL